MSILYDLKELLLPRLCAVCNHRLKSNEKEICLACSVLLPTLNIQRTDDNDVIRMLWPNVPVAHAVAILGYRRQSSYHNIFMRMKYHGGQSLAFYLGRWAAIKMDKWQFRDNVDVVVPVPISRSKLRKRGFNQALSLAQGLASVMHLPVCDCLRCKDDLETQKRLNVEQREQNVKARYTAKVPEKYRGRRFLIVDDVITTGATISACALALLKESPDAEICAFALAKSM